MKAGFVLYRMTILSVTALLALGCTNGIETSDEGRSADTSDADAGSHSNGDIDSGFEGDSEVDSATDVDTNSTIHADSAGDVDSDLGSDSDDSFDTDEVTAPLPFAASLLFPCQAPTSYAETASWRFGVETGMTDFYTDAFEVAMTYAKECYQTCTPDVTSGSCAIEDECLLDNGGTVAFVYAVDEVSFDVKVRRKITVALPDGIAGWTRLEVEDAATDFDLVDDSRTEKQFNVAVEGTLFADLPADIHVSWEEMHRVDDTESLHHSVNWNANDCEITHQLVEEYSSAETLTINGKVLYVAPCLAFSRDTAVFYFVGSECQGKVADTWPGTGTTLIGDCTDLDGQDWSSCGLSL